MSFAHGEMLFLLWVAPLLLGLSIWGSRRRQALLRQFASKRALASIAPDVSSASRIVKIALRLLAVLSLATALAGVRYGYTWETIERKGVDLLVALDCSRSMLADDISPNRLERARRKIHDLLGMIEGDKVGLVAFAGTAFLQCPLTLDYGGFDLFLNALEPDFLPVGGTDLAGAINTALQSFDPKDNAERAIILITDGEATTPGTIEAARQAAEQKVKVFCVGIGSIEGAPIPDGRGGFRKDKSGGIVHSKLDEETLQQVAALTGGTYVRSVTGDLDLEAIYRGIRSALEAKTLQSGRVQLYKDRFRLFVGLALAALLLDLLLPARTMRRPGRNGTVAGQPLGRTTVAGFALLCLLAGSIAPAMAASPASLAEQGLQAWESEDYEAALKAYLDAQIQAPDNPALSFNVGNAQYRLNRFEEARQNYLATAQRLEKAEAPPDRALKARALYNAGNASFRLNDLPGAIGHYEAALKLAPDDEQAKDNLAFVRKMLEQQQQEQENQQSDQSGDKQQQDQEQSGQGQDQKHNSSQDQPSSGQQHARQEEPQDRQGSSGEQPEQKPSAQNGQADEQDNAQPEHGAARAEESQEQEKTRQQGQQEQEENRDAREIPPAPDEQAPAPDYAKSIDRKDLQPPPHADSPKAGQAEAEQASRPRDDKPEDAASALDAGMLNRLKDKPGRGLMPRQQRRSVEKDW